MHATIAKVERLDWPLMKNNISRADLDAVIDLLRQDDPILTQSRNVEAFEREWSDWLGVRRSVMVNSGSSANWLTIAALKELRGSGQVIVPALTWVSDIASVLHAGLEPVFVDVDRRTLGMDLGQVLDRINEKTRAVFITHILGYNALTPEFVRELELRKIVLIEDVCESHGATMNGVKLGTFGDVSNFSFYYAHHLSTIEGGMISTDDDDWFETVRLLRSHGMARELSARDRKEQYSRDFPDLNPDFIFALPGFNVRSTEVNAVIGRAQLRRLDATIERRRENLTRFLDQLDPEFFQIGFLIEGSSNYAFTLILNEPDVQRRDAIEKALRAAGVEFRRGTSGGGNQLRQPYLRRLLGDDAWKQCPVTDHIHFFGWYIGNYPTLEVWKIDRLCELLNETARAATIGGGAPLTSREGAR